MPQNYDIVFEPNFKNFTFLGKEKIQLDVSKPTNILVLNAAELKIKHCHVVSKGKILKAAVRLDAKNEEMTIKLPEKIGGKAVIVVDEAGNVLVPGSVTPPATAIKPGGGHTVGAPGVSGLVAPFSSGWVVFGILALIGLNLVNKARGLT